MRVSYHEAISQYLGALPADTGFSLHFVYTPMHGVGLAPMEAMLRALESKDCMVVVREQAQPDPEFPTVDYPNPEEAGALDLAKATADQQNVRLVLATLTQIGSLLPRS